MTHLRCQAHTDVSHNELVLLRLTGAMERGEVDARGGMVAGSVLMEDVQVQGKAHCVLLATSSAPTLHDQCSLLSTVCKRRGCGAV